MRSYAALLSVAIRSTLRGSLPGAWPGLGIAIALAATVGLAGPAGAQSREALTTQVASTAQEAVRTPYAETLDDLARNAFLPTALRRELGLQLASELAQFDHVRVAGPLELKHRLELPEELYFAASAVSAYDAMESAYVDSDCDAFGDCPFPVQHDLTTDHFVTLRFDFASHGAYEAVTKYVAGEDGTALTLTINGVAQTRAENPGRDHYSVHFLTHEDTMMILVGTDAWYPAAPPWPTWHVAVQLWGELRPELAPSGNTTTNDSNDTLQVADPNLAHATQTGLEAPVMSPFAAVPVDPWGVAIDVGSDWAELESLAPTLFAEQTAVVVPASQIKSFWTSTIGLTVLNGRCMTCHRLDTQAKLTEQHGFAVPITKVPSILVAGKQVNHCQNCHETFLPTHFEERKWATPTPELGVNWLQIIAEDSQNWPRNICNRMLANMPDPETRRKHFHEDARLFWAVESGVVPGGQKSTAPPHDYQVFLDRFDEWNDAGATCPQ